MKNFWKIVGNKYPLANEYLDIWLTVNKKMDKEYNIRDLYDFFDEQEIYGLINFIWNWNIETSEKYGNEENNYLEFDSGEEEYKSRQEAEQAMFLKAFEILEEQLKTK